MRRQRQKNAGSLKALQAGKATVYPNTYNPSLLEVFPNKSRTLESCVELEAFEFSCLCPITGQPDQATVHIRYIPNRFLVESKSLKLYLFSFRNHGTFHEDVINTICLDLDKAMKGCRYLEVFGRFHSRGGIAIYPKAIVYHDKKYKELSLARKLMTPFESHH